jgi:hypothetical protein
MPLTPSPAAGPRRRSMLAGTLGAVGPLAALGALGAVTGCSGEDDGGDDARATREEHRLRKEAAEASRALLARYEATITAHSGLAGRLRPLREATLQHVKAFDSRSKDRERRDEERDGRASGHGAGRKPAVPGKESAALTALGDAERRTAERHTRALAAASPELARLLASVAAAGAAHAYLLGADGETGEGEGA